MEKTNGYYMAKYLKNNAVVLICELVIVLLLSVICTVILDGDPVWLAPVLALVAYLMAELRFMMAYVATNARHDYEMEKLQGGEKGADEEQEPGDVADEQEEEDDTAFAPVVAEDTEEAEQDTYESDEFAPVVAEQTSFEDEWEQDAVEQSAEEDEALSEDFAVESKRVELPGYEQETLESVEMDFSEDDGESVDGMTMQDDDFDKDVLDIGEIE